MNANKRESVATCVNRFPSASQFSFFARRWEPIENRYENSPLRARLIVGGPKRSNRVRNRRRLRSLEHPGSRFPRETLRTCPQKRTNPARNSSPVSSRLPSNLQRARHWRIHSRPARRRQPYSRVEMRGPLRSHPYSPVSKLPSRLRSDASSSAKFPTPESRMPPNNPLHLDLPSIISTS